MIYDPATVCSTEGFMYFVRERENIKLKRDAGLLAPWTDDDILHKYKFTNVRRADDRVSKWIITQLIEPNPLRQDLWFVLLIARLINWPPTLQRLIDDGILLRDAGDFSTADFSASIEQFKAEGNKVYSGAYMLYPTSKGHGQVKSISVGDYIIGSALENADEIDYEVWRNVPTVMDFVGALAKCYGISTFMAGQVAADLTYAEAPLSNALDLLWFAPIGPGSTKGLNYLTGNPLGKSWKQDEFNTELMLIRSRMVDEMPEFNDTTLHDVQNCLCEFSKYARTVLGEGKPKTTYNAETEF